MKRTPTSWKTLQSDFDHSPLRALRNEQGSVLVFVVLLLIVFLGLCAFAIDLGMLHVARGEAQRSADAAAHAGAAVLFRNDGATEAQIKDQAIRVGERNLVRGGTVSIMEGDVDVLWDEGKVRAWVYRTQERSNPVRTLFAGILGFNRVNVAASAAAEIWTASHAECVLPLAIPDRWCEDGSNPACNEYPGNDDYWEGAADGDFYIPWVQNPQDPPLSWVYNDAHTGYSDADRGASLVIRPPTQGPGDNRWHPSWWSFFTHEGESVSNQIIEDRILGCGGGNDGLTGVGDGVIAAPGARQNLVLQGGAFDQLISQDPSAVWNETLACVTDDVYGQSNDPSYCRDSPRIRPMVLFNPEDGPDSPAYSDPWNVQNLVAIFVESMSGSGNTRQVNARFVEYVGAFPAAQGSGSGSLMKFLRIVE